MIRSESIFSPLARFGFSLLTHEQVFTLYCVLAGRAARAQAVPPDWMTTPTSSSVLQEAIGREALQYSLPHRIKEVNHHSKIVQLYLIMFKIKKILGLLN